MRITTKTQAVKRHNTTLPRSAYLPINRCNLPAVILGSYTFQQHPVELTLDGVSVLHAELFSMLAPMQAPGERAQRFMDYMDAHFLLNAPEDAGYDSHSRIDRTRADYKRILRGWAFNPDGQEAAVLKGWVEARFGLTPRFHGEPIRSLDDESYHAYQHSFATGVYNTNSLEAQLDLLYTYSQYEIAKRHPGQTHITLYRGSNAIEPIPHPDNDKKQKLILLNNINSLSTDPERAGEFGDSVYRFEVPLSKIFFYAELLPHYLKAENEFIVIGGVYASQRLLWPV